MVQDSKTDQEWTVWHNSLESVQNSDDKFYCFHMDTYNNVYDLEIYHFFDVFQVIPFKL